MFRLKAILFTVAAVGFAACGGAGPEVKEEPVTNTKDQSKRVAKTVASHTIKRTPETTAADNSQPVTNSSKPTRKWSRSGRPIDTRELDKAVAEAESKLESLPDDESAKKALGKAYFERGVELTSAQQYAAAMGDFRKALKFDPSNEAARKQLAMIVSIYRTLKIEAPAEGEEPAPLEFEGQKN